MGATTECAERAPVMLRHAPANALIEIASQIDYAVPSLEGKIGGAAADVAEVVSPNAESLRAPDMLRHAQANALIEVASQIDCAVPRLMGKIGGATADVAGRWMSDVEQNPTMPLID